MLAFCESCRFFFFFIFEHVKGFCVGLNSADSTDVFVYLLRYIHAVQQLVHTAYACIHDVEEQKILQQVQIGEQG